MSRLRTGERCPIHGGYYCCGRERKSNQAKRYSGPVQKLPDGREKCSKSEMRRRLPILLHKQGGMCGICLKPIEDFREAVIDHILPRGMGGGSRDDSWKNIQAAHGICNLQKGSRRL